MTITVEVPTGGKRYEIEVPEGAEEIVVYSYAKNRGYVELSRILPRPKVKREGWVNVYKLPHNKSHGSSNTIYNTEQEAKYAGELLTTYIATVHVGPWEEEDNGER